MPLLSKTVGGLEVFRSKMSDFQVKMHSKENCRECHGRGFNHWTLPDASVEVHTCKCVDKRLAKLSDNKTWFTYRVTSPQGVSEVSYDTSRKFRETVKSWANV